MGLSWGVDVHARSKGEGHTVRGGSSVPTVGGPEVAAALHKSSTSGFLAEGVPRYRPSTLHPSTWVNFSLLTYKCRATGAAMITGLLASLPCSSRFQEVGTLLPCSILNFQRLNICIEQCGDTLTSILALVKIALLRINHLSLK